jgi:uncharacterized protein YndB with AHSA1/START domain
MDRPTHEDDDILELARSVRASPPDVFNDWTIPDRLLAWWGDPGNWWLTCAQVDLRVGGEFWLWWENTRHQTGRIGGRYKLIEPDTRIVCSFVGSHAKDIDDELEIALHSEGQGTHVALRHSGLAGRPERYADYLRGWTLILSWLAWHHRD